CHAHSAYRSRQLVRQSTGPVLRTTSAMLASRTAFQATRRARIQPIIRTARRLESRYSSRDLNSRDNTAPAIIGGIIGGFIGGSVVALFGYAYYHYSGAATVVNTAHDAMAKFEDTHKKTTERAPDRRD